MHADHTPQDDSRRAPRQIRTDLVKGLSKQLLYGAKRNTLGTPAGETLLQKIESDLCPEERRQVVNAVRQVGVQYVGVVGLLGEKLTRELLDRLLCLGLDLRTTFSITVYPRGIPRVVHGANVYHFAAFTGNSRLLTVLPNTAEFQNAKTEDGDTPLILAVRFSNRCEDLPNVIEVLSDKGADFDARNNEQRQAFHYAQNHGNSFQIIQTLLDVWRNRDAMPVSRWELESAWVRTLLNSSESARKLDRFIAELLVEIPVDSPPCQAGRIVVNEKSVDGVAEDLFALIAGPSKIGFPLQPSTARDFKDLGGCLERLSAEEQVLGEAWLFHLLNTFDPETGELFLAKLFLAHAGREIISRVIELGARWDIRFDSTPDPSVVITDGTILHHVASANEDVEDVSEILQLAPELANRLDGDRNSALHSYLNYCLRTGQSEQLDSDIIHILASRGCPVNGVNAQGVSPLDLAFKMSSLSAVAVLLQYGAEHPASERGRSYRIFSVDGEEVEVDFRGLVEHTLRWQHRLSDTSEEFIDVNALMGEAMQVFAKWKNVHHTYLYLKAACDIQAIDGEFRRGKEAGMTLLEFTYALLFHYPPDAAHNLVFAIETMSDNVPSIQSAEGQFYEDILLLMLNHSKRRGLVPEEVNPITRALTSVTRFIDHGFAGHNLGYSPVWNFARLGLCTHGLFRTLRFEAQPLEEYDPAFGWVVTGASMLEGQLGMVRVPSSPHFPEPFGRRFLLLQSGDNRGISATLPGRSSTTETIPLSRDTVILPCRGHVAVSHPHWGTLIIRNSSPEFGRWLLTHAAYWDRAAIGDGMTYRDLTQLTPAEIERQFFPVLEPSLYLRTKFNTEAIYQLLRQLDVLRDYNRRQKFDTNSSTAFTLVDGKSRFSASGGYRSPAFRSIVTFLDARFRGVKQELHDSNKATRDVPELALCKPFYPPSFCYPFVVGSESRTRLIMTDAVLQSLWDHVNGIWTKESRRLATQTGVTQFFACGVDNEGELVLLAPRDAHSR